jgi:hydrogenase expression/formation protein HypE
VRIVTGDTKVVERGKGDSVFITTTGIGLVAPSLDFSADRARPGDRIILSGFIGDHCVAVMSKRANLRFETDILSDSAALHELVAAMVNVAGDSIRLLRDPTRAGLAATLNEIAQQSGVGMRIEERLIPVRPEVEASCELLGLDPLNVANEGKLVAVVAREAEAALPGAMRAHPQGQEAAAIGDVIADEQRFVQMATAFGGGRIVDWLAGEPIPRIC